MLRHVGSDNLDWNLIKNQWKIRKKYTGEACTNRDNIRRVVYPEFQMSEVPT